MTHTTITVPAARYIDSDDCLADAASDFYAQHPKAAGWDVNARWADEQRNAILLDVPSWTVGAGYAVVIDADDVVVFGTGRTEPEAMAEAERHFPSLLQCECIIATEAALAAVEAGGSVVVRQRGGKILMAYEELAS